MRFISFETRRTYLRMRDLEEQLANDLARQIHVPPGSIIITTVPVPRVELKIVLTASQLAVVEQFLDRLRGTPRVNARVNTGLH